MLATPATPAALRWFVPVASVLVGAACAVAAACSSFESSVEPTDAGMDTPLAEGGPDASDGGDVATGGDGGCDPRGPFGPPVLLAGMINDYIDYGARLSRDELTIYFASGRVVSNSTDLYVATRANLVAAFDTPRVIPELSSTVAEDSPHLSADGRELFFAHGIPGDLASFDIEVARRPSLDAGFGPRVGVAAANGPGADLQPFLADNGDLYFSSTRSGAFDIFWLARLGDGGFAPVQPVSEINTAAPEQTPVLSFDLLTIYFLSGRNDGDGLGDPNGGDIWVSHRSSATAEFGTPERVVELNMKGPADFPTWLSADNCRLYMSSSRSRGLQIYVATRPR